MAAKRFEMVQATTQSAAGNSAAFTVATATLLMVGVDLTAVTGTPTDVGFWLQGSDDGGSTWYDLMLDAQMKTSTGVTNVQGSANQRNITGATPNTGTGKFTGSVYSLPTDTIRLAWAVAGGTAPTFSFSASAVCK